MPAAERDLTIEAGSSYRMRITWCQPREKDTDPLVPYDLTGAQVYMELRQRYGSPVLLGLDSVDSGGLTVEPTLSMAGADGAATRMKFRGCIEVKMRPEQTSAIGVRRGRYDIIVKMPPVDPNRPQDVEVYRLLQGRFECSRVVTVPEPSAALLTAALITLPTAPDIPVVDLTWPRVRGASYYDLLRDGVLVQSTRAITLRDIPPAGPHIYTLRAHNVWGQTTDSDPVPVQVGSLDPEVPVVTPPVVTDPDVPVVTDPATPVVTPDPATPVVTPDPGTTDPAVQTPVETPVSTTP